VPELIGCRAQGSFLDTFLEEKTTCEHAHSMENEWADQHRQAGVTRGFRENLSHDKGYSDKTEQPEEDAHVH
jgi:hypothetical protein